jgi:hypothetical protein
MFNDLRQNLMLLAIWLVILLKNIDTLGFFQLKSVVF